MAVIEVSTTNFVITGTFLIHNVDSVVINNAGELVINNDIYCYPLGLQFTAAIEILI